MNVEAELAQAGKRLLAPGAPALERMVALEQAGSARVFAAARHEIVTEVLSDEAIFSLGHYDRLLEQILPGTRYLVGENDASRQVRLRQLRAAQGWLDQRRAEAGRHPAATTTAACPAGTHPNMAADFRAWIAAMARDEADAILNVLEQRARTGEAINFVREYAFLIAWRMARRIVGVPAPDGVPPLVRLIVAGRNAMRPGPWLRLKDELGASVKTLVMLQPLFGHVFGTITTSPGWMQWLCRKTAPPALAAIDAALAMPRTAPADSFLRALVAVRPQFPGVEDYDLQARSLLFELTGALLLIVGKSLSEMAAFVTSPEGKASGIGWNALVMLLADRKTGVGEQDAIVNEVLRLAGGSRLTRTVRTDGTWRGIDLQAGDRVVVLVAAASRDPAAFVDPERFAPDQARPYITSGPLQGPHVCYGRGIAWTIMREAIAATAGRIRPVEGARLSVFAGLPDDLSFAACCR